MANLANLVVVITGDDSGLNAAFGRAEARSRSFASRVGGSLLGGPLRDVGRLLSNSLNAAFIGVGAGLAYSAKKAVDLESSFVQINKAANLPADQFALLQTGLKDMAGDASIAGVSLDELLGIATEGGKLGIADKEGVDGLLRYTRALAMTSVAIDDLPIEEVSKSLGQLANVYKVPTDQTLNLASAFDALADASTADAGDLFDVAQRLSGPGKATGLKLDELLGLSASALDVGINPEAAGGALSRILDKIVDDSDGFAAQIGIDPKQFADMAPMEKLKSTFQALAALPTGAPALEFLSEVGIKGVNAKNTMLMLAQSFDNVGRLTSIAGQELQNGSHILSSVEMNSNTTASALTLLLNNIQLTAAAIGQSMLPILKSLGSVFGEIAVSIRGNVEENQGTMAGWQAAVVGAIDTVGVIWRNLGLIWEQTQIRITEKVINIQEIISWFGGVAKQLLDWFGANWPQVFYDAFNAAWTVAQNSLTNIANLAGETWDFITSLGKNPIEFQMTPLLEGFKSTVGALPEIKGPQFTSLQPEIDAVTERMVQNEMEHQERKNKAKAASNPAAPQNAIGALMGSVTGIATTIKPGQPGGPAKPAGPAAPEATKMTGQTLGLPEYAKRLQQGAFKDSDNHAKKTAKATQDTANGVKTLPERIAGALGGMMVAKAVGPA